MIHLHFLLLDVDKIAPWGDQKPVLHWFGLTMGWFWIGIGEQELFRYSESAQVYWASKFPEYPRSSVPYDDYQVARYWEDLMAMLPEVLDPVPDDLCAVVADAAAWERWQTDARLWMEAKNTAAAWDTYYTAVGWWTRRQWDAGHLAYPPNIWLWRSGEMVNMRWDNSSVTLEDGIPVWSATEGAIALSVSNFIAEVTAFNDRFLAAMAARVESVSARWSRPEIALDPASLRRAQQSQSHTLKAAVNPWATQVQRGFTWDQVRTAIEEITTCLP